ncbi:MAG: hypothetical protein AAF291_15655 [Pseudomonadota bacterium]
MSLLARLALLAAAAAGLAGCTTIQDVIAYGKGPFDHGPIPRSETALEGLHESSWGNSGKWGAKDSDEEATNEPSPGDEDGAPETEPVSDPPVAARP